MLIHTPASGSAARNVTTREISSFWTWIGHLGAVVRFLCPFARPTPCQAEPHFLSRLACILDRRTWLAMGASPSTMQLSKNGSTYSNWIFFHSLAKSTFLKVSTTTWQTKSLGTPLLVSGLTGITNCFDLTFFSFPRMLDKCE